MAPVLAFYQTGRAKGGFDGGIQLALQRILSDPEFVFRAERDPQPAAQRAAYRITDLELASRLSFFLWSSVPDDELLSAAAQGRLKEPQVLERQVRRMLADSRAVGARRQLRRAMAVSAQPAERRPQQGRSFPTSTTTCGRRCSARPSCSRARDERRTAACWSC